MTTFGKGILIGGFGTAFLFAVAKAGVGTGGVILTVLVLAVIATAIPGRWVGAARDK
jgi:hypothetical protein